MKLGVDLSSLEELKEIGAKYSYMGKEIEPLSFFSHHSHISTIRIRLWNDPYDEDGNPYGGGTNDLPTFINIAKKAMKEGMKVMLDFHYSDFYVDPARQTLPKAWKDISSLDELANVLYEYTYKTLKEIKDNGIDLESIQVGNEITHGMLWPFGEIRNEYDPIKGGGWKGLSILLKHAIKACKEIYPNSKIVIHLEHSGSFNEQDEYLSHIIAEGVEFDVIGESYYPFWHGPFPMFKDCISRIKEKYKKEIWVTELGYEYMSTGVEPDLTWVTDVKEDDFVVGNVNGRIPFPQTKEGQRDYIAMMLKICKELGIGMIFYWEPAWIYMPGNGWAKPAGERYCGLTPSEPVNTWVIETFFDLKGEANPSIDVFTQEYVDKL